MYCHGGHLLSCPAVRRGGFLSCPLSPLVVKFSRRKGGDFLKHYYVDVSELSPDEKENALKLIDGFAFMSNPVPAVGIMVGIDVYWTSQEDFTLSPAFPVGCPCREL